MLGRWLVKRELRGTFSLIALLPLWLLACSRGQAAINSPPPFSAHTESQALMPRQVAGCKAGRLHVENLTLYRSLAHSGRTWSLIGTLTNNAATSVNQAVICVQIINRDHTISTRRTFLATSLLAHESVPFRVRIEEDLTQASDVLVWPEDWDQRAVNSSFSRAVYRRLEVQNLHAIGGSSMRGTIKNIGDGETYAVRILIGAYDKSNNLIGVYEAALDELFTIRAGESIAILATTDRLIGPQATHFRSIAEGVPRQAESASLLPGVARSSDATTARTP